MKTLIPFSRALWGLGGSLLLLPNIASAQTTGTVRGSLLDAKTGQALPFANVVLYRALPTDSSLVRGVQTEENGTFALEKLAGGQYTLRASVLGYAPLRRPLTLSAATPEVQLGTLRLAPSATRLGEVTVQGEKAAVVDNLDKKVINVAKDLTSVGGTALNVLQNVPSVNVDQTGQVTLRGTPNVTIYINGKPTGAAGGGRSVNLDQIPASRIETVEVMTNPSAKYDAEGSGGIINIVLKKQREDGVNGNLSANVGTGDKYNSSLSLNRRAGKLNLFMSYDWLQEAYRGHNSVHQYSALDGTAGSRFSRLTTITDQTGDNHQQRTTHSGRLGFDYAFSDQHTLTIAVQPSYTQNRLPEQLTTQLATRYAFREPGQPDSVSAAALSSNNLTRSRYPSVDYTLDYRRTWTAQPRRELTFGAVYSPLDGEQVLSQRQNEGQPLELLQRQDIHFTINQGAAQVDHVYPVGEKGRVDAGLKTTYRHTDGTYDFTREQNGEQVRDASRSNSYVFNEYVQAGYVQYQNETTHKLKVQAGLRVETTTLRGLLRNTGQEFPQDYVNFFPSATLAQALPHDQELQLSFSRRINRPDVSMLLPFTNYSDPRNYRVGNVALRPENINALELNHQKSWGGATLTSTIFYRLTQNEIQRRRTVDEAASATAGIVVTRATFVNAARNEAYGLELSLSQPLTKWWRLTANGSAFRNIVSATTGTEADFRNVAFTTRLNTTITPLKGLDVQLTGSYRSAFVTNQGQVAPLYSADVAASKRLLHDRGTLTARVSDVFNMNRFLVDVYGVGLESNISFKRETRVAWLGFSYRFGQGPAQRRQQPQGGGGGGIGG
jgi:outer membrane receptor protein involved in Fe transport